MMTQEQSINTRGRPCRCELLETLGCHDDTYGLLCGCVLPATPHRYVPVPMGLDATTATGAAAGAVPSSWAEYHAMRGLDPSLPLPLLLSWPLTVLHALDMVGLAHETARPLVVHYLGPEKEVSPRTIRVACHLRPLRHLLPPQSPPLHRFFHHHLASPTSSCFQLAQLVPTSSFFQLLADPTSCLSQFLASY